MNTLSESKKAVESPQVSRGTWNWQEGFNATAPLWHSCLQKEAVCHAAWGKNGCWGLGHLSTHGGFQKEAVVFLETIAVSGGAGKGAEVTKKKEVKSSFHLELKALVQPLALIRTL